MDNKHHQLLITTKICIKSVCFNHNFQHRSAIASWLWFSFSTCSGRESLTQVFNGPDVIPVSHTANGVTAINNSVGIQKFSLHLSGKLQAKVQWWEVFRHCLVSRQYFHRLGLVLALVVWGLVAPSTVNADRQLTQFCHHDHGRSCNTIRVSENELVSKS